MIVKKDGSLWATGAYDTPAYYSVDGQVKTSRNKFVKIIASDVQAVAAGTTELQFFTLLLKKNGTLLATGANNEGQLGDGSTTQRGTFLEVIPAGVKAVAAGTASFSMFLKEDGSLWTAGDNTYGQLGDGSNSDRKTFQRVLIVAENGKESNKGM